MSLSGFFVAVLVGLAVGLLIVLHVYTQMQRELAMKNAELDEAWRSYRTERGNHRRCSSSLDASNVRLTQIKLDLAIARDDLAAVQAKWAPFEASRQHRLRGKFVKPVSPLTEDELSDRFDRA